MLKIIGMLWRRKLESLNPKLNYFHDTSMLYFSFIHSYINRGNIADSRLNLKDLLSKQKHSVRITISEKTEAHARPVLKEIHALNFYLINILEILKFM